MSSFGKLFKVTTYVPYPQPKIRPLQLTVTHAPSYGESHCRSVGCIVEGVPPGLKLSEEDIQPQLTRRRPGQSALATPRDEKDRVQIQSGTEYGLTLGTPIGLVVLNESHRPEDYGKGTMDLYVFTQNTIVLPKVLDSNLVSVFRGLPMPILLYVAGNTFRLTGHTRKFLNLHTVSRKIWNTSE